MGVTAGGKLVPVQPKYKQPPPVEYSGIQASDAPVSSDQDEDSPIPTNFTMTLGLLLVIVVGISSGQFKSIWDAIWNGNIQKGLKQDAFVFGGEILFIFILAFLAETGPDANHAILAFFFALWAGWFIFNGPTVLKWSQKLTGVQHV